MTDWIRVKLSDCLARVERPVNVVQDKHYTQIGIRSHGKGVFHKESVTGEELGNKAVYWVEPDCFVLNIVFAWEQAIGKTTASEAGMIASHRFPMYRPKKELIDIDYLIYFFMTKRGKDVLDAASPGGAGRNRTLGQKTFLNSNIVLPPVAEQRKIADILSAQDKVIELKTKLLEEKKRLKKYLCQVLLSGKRRFSSFSDKWKQNPLSDFLTESRLRGSNGKTAKKLTVKLWGKGVTEKKETLSGSENTAYFRRTKGQFIYSKLDFLNGAFGIIPDELDGYESTIDLPAFDVHHINTEFLLLCVSDAAFYKRNGAIANGGRKAKRINPNDFLSFCINHPSLSEQTSIVDVFRRVDEVIALCENEIKQEQFKKKALMQLLLTGKIRVKV